jgi:tetratricopeptide (TPR) repeat protein
MSSIISPGATQRHRLDTAIALGEYVVSHNPVAPTRHSNLAYGCSSAGRHDEAIATYHTALGLSQDHEFARYGKEGPVRCRARGPDQKHEEGAAYNIAYVLAYRGDADRAFEWLDKAVKYHDPGLPDSGNEPMFANIHHDPRWLPFLRKIGMAPEQLAAIRFDVKVPK